MPAKKKSLKRPRPSATTSTSSLHAQDTPRTAQPKQRKRLPAVDTNWKQLLQSGKVKPRTRRRKRPSQSKTTSSELSSSPSSVSTVRSSCASFSAKMWASEEERETTRLVALDCEMVGVGSDMQSRLARVCVVTEKGKVMLDKYCRPSERITDFRTRWSGIRAVDLLGAPSIEEVQQEACDLIRGKVVVGHALKHDFDALLFKPTLSLVRDTASYRPLQKRAGGTGKWRRQKLRDLALQELQWVIQEGEHDPYIDARAALEIYKRHAPVWEAQLKERRASRQGRRASKKRKRQQQVEAMQQQLRQSKDIFSRKR